MKKRNLFIRVMLVLGLAMTICFIHYERTDAQDCRIVRIHSTAYIDPKIRIEPETVWISKGSCVVWVNWAGTEEVKVIFEEGKKCEDMTDAPTGFKLDAHNCYVTSFVKLGSTSSLRFVEEGTFEYVVEVSAKISAKGKIIVR